MSTLTLVALLGQAMFAAGGVLVLRGRVLAAIPALRQPAVYTDVWVPLVAAGPLVILAARVEGSVAGIGWAPLGASACLGALAVGAALLAGTAASLGGWIAIATGGVGLLLLLLGAVNDLTIWTGQCTFAVAAVLLWVNTPSDTGAGDPRARGASVGLVLALLLAVGQCACGLKASVEAPSAAMAIAVVAGAAIVLLALRHAGLEWGLHIGGWTAALGTMLGIGMLSVMQLVPQALTVAGGAGQPVEVLVAYGFGRYAPEATLLLVLPLAAFVSGRLPVPARRAIGAFLVLSAVALTVLRLVR